MPARAQRASAPSAACVGHVPGAPAARAFKTRPAAGVRICARIWTVRTVRAANAGQVKIDTVPFTPGVNVRPGTTMGDFQFLTP
jgi:hypothetical protein